MGGLVQLWVVALGLWSFCSLCKQWKREEIERTKKEKELRNEAKALQEISKDVQEIIKEFKSLVGRMNKTK